MRDGCRCCAFKTVSDKLLDEPSSSELNTEGDRLEAARKKLTCQAAKAERRLLAAAEKVQQSLKADIHAVNDLCVAWSGCVAERQATAFLESIAPARKPEVEPLCRQLALLSTEYLHALEQFWAPAETSAWTARLLRMPSQKLDTGLLKDPLFHAPDIEAQIKAILAAAEMLVLR